MGTQHVVPFAAFRERGSWGRVHTRLREGVRRLVRGSGRRIRAVPTDLWWLVAALVFAAIFMILLVHDPYYHAGK